MTKQQSINIFTRPEIWAVQTRDFLAKPNGSESPPALNPGSHHH